MEVGELIAFILYFATVLGMGVYFFVRGRGDMGEKSFFLGGRKMRGLIAAPRARAAGRKRGGREGLDETATGRTLIATFRAREICSAS